MLLTLFPVLLSLLVPPTSALTAVCEFEGAGTGEVRGSLLLTEYDTPDGTEIE